jgi:hypothetical protein
MKSDASKMTDFIEKTLMFLQDYGRCNFPITSTKYAKDDGGFIDRKFFVSITLLHVF